MSDALTSDLLVESIKRRASIPESQSTFTKNDFLEFANEEMRLGIVPSIMSLHEDYLLFEIDIPLVDGKYEYTIPSRAVGNKLRDVQLKISEGNYSEMVRGSIGDRFDNAGTSSLNNLRRYYIKNNKVVLSFNSNLQGSLTMIFYIKPSKIVQEDRVGVITGINTVTGEIVLDTIPDNFNTSVSYDFYKAQSPFSILEIDKTSTNLNTTTNTITFTAASIPDDLSVGDHIALAGECSIPQVPNELQVMLAQMVACRVLESQGDVQGLQLAMAKLGQMETAAGMIIDNRVDDSPQKVINRHSLVRTATYAKRFNRK